MQLKTKRLLLRNLRVTDAKQITVHMGMHISQYLLVVPHPYTHKHAMQFITKAQKAAKKKSRNKYDFAIVFEGKLIGCISLTHIDFFHGTAEIGYWLSQPHQGRGFMTEAVDALVDFAFRQLQLRRIDAYVFAENHASQKLLTKTGFVHEGTTRKEVKSKVTGKEHDVHIYGLLREEWK